jgi:RNA polymerase sigma-70 factor (ECF subfamily)
MSAVPARDRAYEMDVALVERARAGERDAFAELVGRHDEGLRALAFRLLDDRDRMDDVLQDAYLKAFRGLPGFRGGSAFGTWLYRIAYNACLDEIERSRRIVLFPLEAADEIPGPAPEVAESVSNRYRLGRALAGLPPEERAAVLLVDAQGFDYGAAAEVLGVPSGTIASRLNRARALLRQALGEPVEGAPDR